MRKSVIAALAILASSSGLAHADVLYNNITSSPYNGDCSFSTTCAAIVGRGDDFAAQAFSLDSMAKLTSGSFAEIDFGTGPTAVNWMVTSANDGLPGATLFSGSSTVSGMTSIGSLYGYYPVSQIDFALDGVKLAAGSYFFAIQAVSPTFSTYLANGLSEGGAAETHDGGLSWSQGYENFGSVGVALSGSTLSAVPLPASFPMFGASLLALGGLGYGVKRRKAASAA